MGPPFKTNQLDLFSDDPERFVSKPKPKPKPKSKPKSTHVGPEPSECPHCKERYLTVDGVAERFSASRATIWRWLKTNPQFPKPIKVSLGATRWKLSDLVVFEVQILAERDASPGITTTGTRK